MVPAEAQGVADQVSDQRRRDGNNPGDYPDFPVHQVQPGLDGLHLPAGGLCDVPADPPPLYGGSR
ncbi:hypothetical protein D3C81_1973190 [compost metagenome]